MVGTGNIIELARTNRQWTWHVTSPPTFRISGDFAKIVNCSGVKNVRANVNLPIRCVLVIRPERLSEGF